MHAMSAYQGVAGVARMFGYPLPLVPEKWRKAAQGTVDLLKQDSSVAAFGAINEKVKDTDEKAKTVRGASLRELERFFKENDSDKLYAGLRRVGDPNDGTAVWTRLGGDKFKDALSERAKQWRVEEELRRKEIFDSDRALDLKPAADEPLPSQSQVDAKGEDVTGDLDAIDGTDPKEVEAALEARAQERRAETKRGEDDYATYLREKAAGGDASADAGDATAAATAAPAAGSGPSAVRALTATPREAGDPEALRRVEDRLTGIEEQLGAIRSIVSRPP